MRILLIGASGTIGSAIRAALDGRHDIIAAGRNGADVGVDITDPGSIAAMYERIGKVDAVVNASGTTHFGPLEGMTPEQNEISIAGKLRGQVNLVLLGMDSVNDRGSFTLTTGIVMDDPILAGASAAMAGGGIRAFVQAAAIEMPRGIRINNVSPSVLEESMSKYAPYFPGFVPVPAAKAAQAYVKSVEGGQTGRTFTVY